MKKTILDGIIRKYRPDLLEPPAPSDTAAGGQEQPMSEKNQPQRRMQDKGKRGGTFLRTAPKTRRQDAPVPAEQKAEVVSDGQT